MKNQLIWASTVCLLSFVVAAQAQVEWVVPSMGGQGFMLEPTRPTVSLPNSLVRVFPVRKGSWTTRFSPSR